MFPRAIEVEHLSKVYGSTVAIEDVHFSVNEGEIIGFIGPNGAGKTTTMRILAGYLPATSGTARIAGYDVHRYSMQVRRRIGYLPEIPPLYPNMTVKQYLTFVSKIKGVKRANRRRQVYDAMVRCQLADREDTIIRKLSQGYKQRLGIAQAIVHSPPVIILDEPTVGLDPRQIIEVRNLIKSLAKKHTVILSTHILSEASMICDRITIINRGKVVTTDTPSGLQTQLKISSGYELEISGNLNLDTFLPLLKSIPGIIHVSLRDNSVVNNVPSYTFQIDCKSMARPGKDIAKTIVEEGFELHELRRTCPSLENIFLELTAEKSSSISNL